MTQPNIVFTPEDRCILESYKTTVEGFAEYLGEGYEVVLHSLENLNHSVIKIINGHHTGRKEGAPITDLALDMLNRIQTEGLPGHISYFTHNKKGEPLKSTTITIAGTEGKIIGLLCINFYLNTPVSSIIADLHPVETSGRKYQSENYADKPQELVARAVSEAIEQVKLNPAIPASLKKREIISILDEQGIFQFKDSVIQVAELLTVSKNTVYLHLRNLHKK